MPMIDWIGVTQLFAYGLAWIGAAVTLATVWAVWDDTRRERHENEKRKETSRGQASQA